MIYRTLALICCMAVFASAQDTLSGTWTGEFTPDGKPVIKVSFQLKLDSKNAVTGTFVGLPTPGDVKSGTFDPKTGVLKLELGKQGETNVRLTLEGKVAKGVATGKFTGEVSGDFRIAKN